MRRVLNEEADAVRKTANNLDENAILQIVPMLLECEGRIVVTGMGKSGAIARKFAATLASTGSPAFFLHPAEAVHGDLGMIVEGDVVFAFSYSGETDELLAILPSIVRFGAKIVVTGRPHSTLGQAALWWSMSELIVKPVRLIWRPQLQPPSCWRLATR